MKKKKKVKVKYKNVFTFFLIVIIIYLAYNAKITNIYISGNINLNDNEIIRIAKIENYPKILSNNSYIIENRLNNNNKIYKSSVHYELSSIYIDIQENYPLFYDSSLNKTILYDSSSTTDNYITPYLLNYIPDNLYKEFIKSLKKLDYNILIRISEIKYDPNEYDEERFFLTMTDGNYIYINLSNFNKLNKYDEILTKLNNKKGILYLDSGEYFEIKTN